MIKMPSISILLFSAMLLAGSPASANDEHHPAGGAEAPATPLNAPGSQMPMGGMMSTMGAGGMPMMGMMTGHIEGRLAFLKTEIKITDVQESKWNVFADAVRGVVCGRGRNPTLSKSPLSSVLRRSPPSRKDCQLAQGQPR